MVTLNASDYFQVRAPNAILPQTQTVSTYVQVRPEF